MTTPYLAHFGFSSAPFSKEIPDDKLWLPTSKVSLIDEICEALRDRESVLLTGEPGVGKTCVLRAIRQRLPQAGFRLTYCHNATLGRRDFYRQLCFALGLSPSATAAAVFWAVSTHVEELGREQRCHPVFLLDEAHLLHQDVLDHLHILLNYQWDSKALLSLVLVGLPDLQSRLAMRRNRSLASRLARYVAIGKLTADDSVAGRVIGPVVVNHPSAFARLIGKWCTSTATPVEYEHDAHGDHSAPKTGLPPRHYTPPSVEAASHAPPSHT
jgi:type II secretory pathway predicted ATPase ExeA